MKKSTWKSGVSILTSGLIVLAALAFITPESRGESYAFPVPYVAGKHSQPLIFFKNLPGAGSIKIFNILGQEVVRLPISTGQAMISWDVKNASGKAVASGVYLYRITTPTHKKTGKLVIIR